MSDEDKREYEPVTVELIAGEIYWWCRCGKSQAQPFCDGSHKGSGIEPMEYTPDRNRKARLCTCKQTKTAPICDNSHLWL
jgi:CDGSH-type Zn-finger protein